jgi:hypothetical protein
MTASLMGPVSRSARPNGQSRVVGCHHEVLPEPAYDPGAVDPVVIDASPGEAIELAPGDVSTRRPEPRVRNAG